MARDRPRSGERPERSRSIEELIKAYQERVEALRADPDNAERLDRLRRSHRRPSDRASDGTDATTDSDRRSGRTNDRRRESTSDRASEPAAARRGRRGGRHVAKDATRRPPERVEAEIDAALEKVNPRWDRLQSAYSENCTSVVQAYEMRRRGLDVRAGPLERRSRSDAGGIGGRGVGVIERTWGRDFNVGTREEVEAAFAEEGARGAIFIRWNDAIGGGGHVFNVENVGGRLRFVDGQQIPPRKDVAYYLDLGADIRYLRMDDLPTPPAYATRRFVEPS